MELVNPGIMQTKVLCWILLSVLLFGGCKQAQYSYQPTVQPVAVNPQMIFLTFSIKMDTLKGSQITLVDKQIVEGKLKAVHEDYTFQNRLVVKQLNNLQQELSTSTVDHPLIKRVEYADDQGILDSKIVNLKVGEFFIRTTLHQETVFIRVEEVIDNKNVAVVTFKIKE